MTVQIVSQPVVAKAFAPGIPIRAIVQKMDTLKIDVTLVDENKNSVDLTGCQVIVTAQDDEKTTLWEPTITSPSEGKFTAVVQPDNGFIPFPGGWPSVVDCVAEGCQFVA